MSTNKLVLGLTGMPGSGKSLIVKVAQELGYDVVAMGDVVREETSKRGLEPTPTNIGKVMLELRKSDGDQVIAEKCIPKIEQKKNTRIIIDGLRSYREVETFMKKLSNFALITVHTSPQTRFERLSTRGRSDDPKNWEVFHERDMRELSVGIGQAIALAEFVIINDRTLEILNARAQETLRSVEAKWKK